MKKSGKRLASLLFALIMVLSMTDTAFAQVSGAVSANDPGQTADQPAEGTELEMEDLDPATLGVKKLGEIQEPDEEEPGIIDLKPDMSLEEVVRVSIFLDKAGTVDAGYSTQGIGTNKAAISYRDSLKAQQKSLTASIEQKVGYSINVKWNLTLLTNAISAYVKVKDIPIIERMAGVKSVEREKLYTAMEGEAADPNTANTSQFMTGAAQSWSVGYTGAGSRIAIIDTGIDTAHKSFNEDAFNYSIGQLATAPDLLDETEVENLLSQLNGQGIYVNAKIPFAYNYVDGNTTNLGHDTDGQSNHGSHVAGIAAANKYVEGDDGYVLASDEVKAVGMAPDAQIISMKVFGQNGGAYDSDYMVAIEDAIILGCDAANLSLGGGSPGYTYSTGYQQILNSLSDPQHNAGTVVSISAGNNASMAYNLKSDLYIDDIYEHTGGSPGSYINSLGVASADNTGVTGIPFKFNGKDIFPGPTHGSLTAGTYDFVYINTIGNESDYAAVNSAVSLSGKMVIVNRGELSFYEKGNNAIDYSPAVLVIANNQPGALGGMQLDEYTGTFPMTSISGKDADLIKANTTAKTASGITYYTGKMTITTDLIAGNTTDRADATISDFSSWGIPGSLIMKPEIAAPGGDIYSVFGKSNASDENVDDHVSYGSYSGTSMAAPHIAGLTGVLAQYIKAKNITVSGYSSRAIMQSLLMSTATPMINDGEYVSLLQQGAGLADVNKAIGAASVVFVGTEDDTLTAKTGAAADGKVKAEFGDDPDKTGVYEYSFTIHNISNENLTFKLNTELFTQGNYTYEGNTYMDTATTRLNANANYTWDAASDLGHDVDKDGDTDYDDAQAILDYVVAKKTASEIDLAAAELDGTDGISSYDAYKLIQMIQAAEQAGTVPAHGSRKVNVKISLTSAQKAALDQTYTSGAYIEGFTYVTCEGVSTSEGVVMDHEHSIPLIGFYGSWTDPNMFDTASVIDMAYGPVKENYSGNISTNYLTINYNGVTRTFSGNPYMIEDTFPADKLAVNSRSNFVNIYYNLVRFAGTTGFAVSKVDAPCGNVTEIVTSAVTGNLVDGLWYDQHNAQWQGTGTRFVSVNKNAADYGFGAGDTFRIGFYAIPEYNGMLYNGNMTDAYAGMLDDTGFAAVIQSNTLGDGAYVGYDFTVDDEAPQIGVASLNGNTLAISASDDRNIAYMAVLSLNGDVVYAESAPGAADATITLDASSAIANAQGYVAVFVGDYAGNEIAKAVKVNDNSSADPYAVTTVTLTVDSLDLYKGNEADIVAEVLPLTAEDRTVSWSSSNTSVATVDQTGHVTAVGAGTATITATANGNTSISASCTVKVTTVNKALNGIVWDEAGEVYFSSFNANNLPTWAKNSSKIELNDAPLYLHSAFMQSTKNLYAGTLDTSARTTTLYSVNRNNYSVTEYGENYIMATDMAVGASTYSKYVGFAYTYAIYLIAGPLAPEDDGSGTEYSGVPYALYNTSDVLGGSYVAAIACKERSAYGGTYYILDENGGIWETTLGLNSEGNGFEFSAPTKVVDTGIATSFIYQSLYYDGTYLYWTHQTDNIAELIIINPSTGAVYHAGNFGEGVWPAAGLYVNGSVAPASTGGESETMAADAAELQNLKPLATRDQLMTEEVQARFAAEAAKFASKAQPAAVEEDAAAPAEQPAGSLNRVKSLGGTKTITSDVEITEDADTSKVTVTYTEDGTNDTNGVAEITYDPAKISFEKVAQIGNNVILSDNPEFRTEGGLTTVRIAYALTGQPADGDVVCVLQFSEACESGVISVKTVERGADLAVAETPTEQTVEGHGHTWTFKDFTWTKTSGGYTAVANFICASSEAHTMTVDASVTHTEGEGDAAGKIIYTATAEYGGQTYTDAKIEDAVAEPAFTVHSLVLSGEIGVNFFMDLPEIDGVDYSTSYMEFTVSGKDGLTTTDPFDENHKNQSGKYYGFTCYVNSIQMADQITATFHYGDGKEVSHVYSVKEYLNTMLNGNYSAEMKALATAIGDYGYYAQAYLSELRGWSLGTDHVAMPEGSAYSESDYTAANNATAEVAIVRDTGDSGIESVSYALALDSSTGIYVYLKPKASYNGTVTAVIGSSTENVAELQSDGRYRIYISGISAHKLKDVYSINVNAGSSFEVKVAALSYVNTKLSAAGTSQKLKDLMVALYNYYEKTMEYRASKQ